MCLGLIFINLKITRQGGEYILKGFGKDRKFKNAALTAVKKWDYYCNFFIHRTMILWEREFKDCCQLIAGGKKAAYVFP